MRSQPQRGAGYHVMAFRSQKVAEEMREPEHQLCAEQMQGLQQILWAGSACHDHADTAANPSRES